MSKNTLFIFRRDLRVHDNKGLVHAQQDSELVTPCFIFDPRQVGTQNLYRSDNAIQFMLESLSDLEQQLQDYDAEIYFFYGEAEDIVEKLLKTKLFTAVYCNRDYTPFSMRRDEEIKKKCIAYQYPFSHFDDALVHEPGKIMTGSGTPYAVFTPFFKNASTLPVASPVKLQKNKGWFKGAISWAISLKEIKKKILAHNNKHIHVQGGSANAQKILKKIQQFKEYKTTRDYPAIATTGLSAHLKFGTVSIRDVYHTIYKQLGSNHLLLQQLFWRDFFTHVAYHSPFVFGQPYREKYARLWWSTSNDHFERWCTGTTGFPIVDAGMRQMNVTGFMHNRVRMIVGSFLVKDLHIDWRLGERYFAQKLVDYDPAVNNGNWQWTASTGCDAQPYFRIFNPWLQQKKYDSQCEYIKQWIPELRAIEPKILHRWNTMHAKLKHNYYPPIVDHAVESRRAKKLYKDMG